MGHVFYFLNNLGTQVKLLVFVGCFLARHVHFALTVLFSMHDHIIIIGIRKSLHLSDKILDINPG